MVVLFVADVAVLASVVGLVFSSRCLLYRFLYCCFCVVDVVVLMVVVVVFIIQTPK